MDRTVIPIRKMHCRSCEILIEQELRKVPGIARVKASTQKAQAMIYSKGMIDLAQVHGAIERAGYEVGEGERRSWITGDMDEYGNLLLAAMILFGLYVIAKRTGFLDLSMSVSGGKDVATSLLVGLAAGISTCMALIGGLVLGVAARFAEKHPESSVGQKFRPHLFFNLGRIASFFVLGGVLGALGGFLSLSSGILGFLTMFIALVMLLMGVQLTEISPVLNAYKLTLPKSISRALGLERHHEKEYSHRSSFTLGALTFFLPCGFTQLMQMNAIASGGFLPGAFLMAAFAAGTAPGLLGVGGLTSVVRGSGAKMFFKTAGLFVIALAFFNFANGYRLTGWAAPWEGNGTTAGQLPDVATAPVENGVQLIRMTQDWSGYKPNQFTVKRGVPVRWIIDAKSPNACSGGISAPAINVTRYFEQGENVIEFTPQKAGTIRFTCTMGMYPGTITVVD